MIGRLTTALGRVREDLASGLDEKALRDLCPGEGLTLATTLLDPEAYPAKELAKMDRKPSPNPFSRIYCPLDRRLGPGYKR